MRKPGPAKMQSSNRNYKDNKPKPGNKPTARREGVKRSMREVDQHDRATKHRGSKGTGLRKKLEGKAL